MAFRALGQRRFQIADPRLRIVFAIRLAPRRRGVMAILHEFGRK
jgi:hypothetical protein